MHYPLISLITLLSVAITPLAAQAEICREFTRTIMIGGRAQEGVGTACRQEDGSWRTMSSGGEEEIAWNDRVIYVERERPVYIEPVRPTSFFQLTLGGDDDRWGRQCHRRGRGWHRGWDDDHGWHRGHGRGHGHGHGRGYGHHGRW